jgi:hypothetical protein
MATSTIFVKYNSLVPPPPAGQQNITFNSSGTKVTALDPIFVGDAGIGGLAGNVPAPAAGDAVKFLRGDGTWGASSTQVQVDWNATSGISSILHKPTLATVAISGNYLDLSNKPTLGSAAALNVGTTAGTVAAGDDSRIVNAVSKALAIAYAIAL